MLKPLEVCQAHSKCYTIVKLIKMHAQDGDLDVMARNKVSGGRKGAVLWARGPGEKAITQQCEVLSTPARLTRKKIWAEPEEQIKTALASDHSKK